MVRFMKAIVQSNRWIYANKDAAVDLLAKEMGLKREFARKGWEFYTEKGLWHPNGDVTLEGLGIVSQIYAEQNQLNPPNRRVVEQAIGEELKDLAPVIGARRH